MKVSSFSTLLCAWAIMLIIAPSSTTACRCKQPVLEDALAQENTSIFLVKVIRELDIKNEFEREFEVLVKRVYKGCDVIHKKQTMIVSTGTSTASCGLELAPKQRYYLSGIVQEGKPVFVGSCGYNFPKHGIPHGDKKRLQKFRARERKTNSKCCDKHHHDDEEDEPEPLKCKTGADCDEFSEYCDGNQCVPVVKTECPDGKDPVQCFINPCETALPCPEAGKNPICVPDYCGGCNVIWLDANRSQVCHSD